MGLKNIIEYNIRVEKHILENLKDIVEKGPKEKLIRKVSRQGYKQYYFCFQGEHKQHYIRKNNFCFVQKLLKIEAAQDAIKILCKNIEAEIRFLKNFNELNFKALKEDVPETFERAGSGSFPQSEKPTDRDKLNQLTTFGLLVRSKGEAIIAELLYSIGVVFRYEKALDLMDEKGNLIRIYPDFTIYLPGGVVIYLEHKGMMGKKSYRDLDADRMGLYHYNGIFEPVNLIVTMDGPNGEINIKAIELLIKEYILKLGEVM